MKALLTLIALMVASFSTNAAYVYDETDNVNVARCAFAANRIGNHEVAQSMIGKLWIISNGQNEKYLSDAEDTQMAISFETHQSLYEISEIIFRNRYCEEMSQLWEAERRNKP